MTTEQLKEIENQKKKLIELITPAIKQFMDDTGFHPSVSISTKSTETEVGTYVYGPEIHVTCWI